MRTASYHPVVLVAEDGEGTRHLSCLVLESYGFVCHGTGTVETAIELVRRDPHIDVVFADIHFPGPMTGVDLALLAQRAPFNIPVLLTSGQPFEYIEDMLPDGVPFLEKPYTPEQLLHAIRLVMRPRSSHTASAA